MCERVEEDHVRAPRETAGTGWAAVDACCARAVEEGGVGGGVAGLEGLPAGGGVCERRRGGSGHV